MGMAQMLANRLSKALNIALESSDNDVWQLDKIVQDDFDDGVQTLVLFHSNGDRETVTRIWPDMIYRGESSGDSLHEVYVELVDSVSDANALWEMIKRMTQRGPELNLFSGREESVSVESLVDSIPDQGVRSIYQEIVKDFSSKLMTPSTEGYVADQFAKAKETLAQWTVGFRKWKSSDWNKLSTEDQVRLIKKANLTFFYYNSQYVKNLENVLKLTKTLSEAVIKDVDTASLDKTVSELKKELTTVLKGAGLKDPSTKLSELQQQFKKTMGSYKAPEKASGDSEVVSKILSMQDKYKLSVSTIDALKAASSGLGLESDPDRERVETVASIISWILFLTGLWPLWILWLLAGRDFFVNAGSGGPKYE